jgi:elongation factor Ts
VDAGERPLLQQAMKDAGTVADALTTQVGQVGENIQITDLVRQENVEGRVGAYVHHDYKQGAIVSVTTGADADKAAATLKALCQHIVVFMPPYCSRADVPADVVEREKAVIAESDEVKKKPEAVRDKIVTGKLNKFYAGSVLADQPWILDDKQSVQKALEAELGAGTRIESFQRVRLGG